MRSAEAESKVTSLLPVVFIVQFKMLCSLALTLLVLFLAATVAFVKWWYKYWERNKVPYIQPAVPGGNVSLFKNRKSLALLFKDWYNEFKSKGHKYGGTFILISPMLNIVDLELVKLVMQKDFHHFMDRGFYHNEEVDPISGHLLSLEGQRWKTLRAKLTPAFTSGKLKMMFQMLVDASVQLEEPLMLAAKNQEPVDIKDVFACFTIDVIGSCAFGLECNAFKEKDSPFKYYGKRIIEPTMAENLVSLIHFCFPGTAKTLRMRSISKDISTFFLKLVNDTVSFREKNNFRRNDFLQLLVDMKNGVDGDDTLTIEEVAAQVFIFFLGGFETSSSTGAFCLYELSINKDIQDKLRKEVDDILGKYDGKITHEAMQDMKYMEQVINGNKWV